MTETDLTFFRKLLNDQLGELVDGAHDTMAGMTASRETFADPTDRATHEANRNFTLRIRDRERKLISKIQEAMERIEQGTFGVCERCGGEIGIARLKVRPVTTLCIDCKEEQERQEKRTLI
ncbi:MAG: RNA polymerase-binding protein DksA [Myxococcales bacterium]|nr:RNA polymerase-binding protein DksA [Myxococcales bacterium]